MTQLSATSPSRPTRVRYNDAEFILGAHQLEQLPADGKIEVAFAGRSNAGKSSALNFITQRKKLARTSKVPGRTQQINYFSLDAGRYLVDLPGYGYAKVPPSQARHWQRTLSTYIRSREALRCVVVLMDIRHPLTQGDWDMVQWCLPIGVDLHFILTKADKLSRNNANRAMQQTLKALEEAGVEATLQLMSVLKGQGLEDAHELLDSYFVVDDGPGEG